MKTFDQESIKGLLRGNLMAVATITVMSAVLLILGLGCVLWFVLGDSPAKMFSMALFFVPALILTLLAVRFFTKNIRSDIRSGHTRTRVSEVKSILEEKNAEAGSGSLYIPVLGSLFPDLFGERMRSQAVKYIVTRENEKFEIPPETNVAVHEPVKIYFSEKSDMYLGCEFGF